MKTNKNKNKRQASSSSDEGATCSDSTVVGSDSESENTGDGHRPIIGAHIPCKRCKALPAAVQQTQTTSTASVESTRNPVSASTQAVTAKPLLGRVPSPPHLLGLNCLHPFLRKGANFLQISADCTRLRINPVKPSAPPTTALKFTAQTRNPSRPLRPGLPVHSVHRLCRRDGSPLWLVLAVLPRTEEAKNIFNNLNMVCGLGYPSRGPAQERGPGQCHRCQLYGHAAANCHADPRCVKCLVPHWTRECPRTRESGEKPSCVNCLQQHTANYRDVRKP
ncbi:Nucleic-acid-binding protein from transposon X-element [Eumeta japonica]|uniref:Nucleic-acid-binding protein from transposon X-element n=1 Tax=Eumeta variegata TaxID=151549 RepID=A0A4C1XKC0_EUMVA|nr:Nucleic-acid-binding protein from transposon X-element [Eumeta japonica]